MERLKAMSSTFGHHEADVGWVCRVVAHDFDSYDVLIRTRNICGKSCSNLVSLEANLNSILA